MPEERNDARQLSPVLENYLEIIFHQEIREGAARASSIAEAAGVSRSTRSADRPRAKYFCPSNHRPVTPVSSAASKMPPSGES